MSGRGGFLNMDPLRPKDETDNRLFLFIDYNDSCTEILDIEGVEEKAKDLYSESSDPDDWDVTIFEIKGTATEMQFDIGVTVNFK